jgi:hypothetical protein
MDDVQFGTWLVVACEKGTDCISSTRLAEENLTDKSCRLLRLGQRSVHQSARSRSGWRPRFSPFFLFGFIYSNFRCLRLAFRVHLKSAESTLGAVGINLLDSSIFAKPWVRIFEYTVTLSRNNHHGNPRGVQQDITLVYYD